MHPPGHDMERTHMNLGSSDRYPYASHHYLTARSKMIRRNAKRITYVSLWVKNLTMTLHQVLFVERHSER